MNINKLAPLAGALVAVGMVGVSMPVAAAQSDLAAFASQPPAPRSTAQGGINLVPTPSGLGLDGAVERIQSSCAIGAGCAARTWDLAAGDDPGNPTATTTMISNVGIMPTTYLARRDQSALVGDINVLIADGLFVGAAVRKKVKGFDQVTVSGSLDLMFDDPLKIVQLRKGKRTVYIEVGRDNLTAAGNLPPELRTGKLVRKARAVFRKSWKRVPHTVLPHEEMPMPMP